MTVINIFARKILRYLLINDFILKHCYSHTRKINLSKLKYKEGRSPILPMLSIQEKLYWAPSYDVENV